MAVVYPMKLNEDIIPLIELKSREEHTNKAIVLKQFLYQGLQGYVMDLVGKGRLSIGKAAEILDVSIYDLHEIAKARGLKLGATKEQRQRSKEFLVNLKKKL